MGWGDKETGPWGKPGNNKGEGSKPKQKISDFDDLVNDFQARLKDFFSGNNNNFRPFLIVIGALVLLWGINGFYKVDPEEQAIILRFGKFNRIADPGLSYHIPFPIESVTKQKVTRIGRVEVGFRSSQSRARGAFQQNLSEESLMLTGDENIVDINFEAQWRISDIKKFTFNVRDPEDTVKSAAESAMREVIGKTPISQAFAEGRLTIEQETQILLQHTLDSYDIGIEVVAVKLLKADPPQQVIDAFRDVQAARIDKERAQNEAQSYRNDIIPRARGEAMKVVQDAEAYKKQIIADSEGQASRFDAVYERYKNASAVTRKRIYLETMEQVMRGMNKIVMDGSKQGVVPYLPLNELVKKKPEKEEPAGGQ